MGHSGGGLRPFKCSGQHLRNLQGFFVTKEVVCKRNGSQESCTCTLSNNIQISIDFMVFPGLSRGGFNLRNGSGGGRGSGGGSRGIRHYNGSNEHRQSNEHSRY